MIDTLRSEWIKSSTARMSQVLIITAIALPTMLSAVTAALNDGPERSGADQFLLVSSLLVISAMFMGVVGATSITVEYDFLTIRPTFAATPRRARVVAAKALVCAAMSLGVGAAVMVGGLILVNAFVRLRAGAGASDRALDVTGVPGFFEAAAGAVLFCVLLGLFGLALGLLVRNTTAAVATLIIWPLLVESTIMISLSGLGVDHPARWLPFQAGFCLWQLTPIEGMWSRWGCGLYLAGFIAALLVCGLIATNRRDA